MNGELFRHHPWIIWSEQPFAFVVVLLCQLELVDGHLELSVVSDVLLL